MFGRGKSMLGGMDQESEINSETGGGVEGGAGGCQG